MVAMASSFSASVASSLNNRIAARASVKASFAALLVSFCSAPSITGSMVSSWVLKTDCAAWTRLAGSGDNSVKPPSAAQAVVETHRRGAVGNAINRRAGRGIDALAVGLGDIDFLGVGIGHQAAVLERADDAVGQRTTAGRDRAYGFFGIGKLVIGEFADRVFERSGHDRQGGRNDEQYCEWERTDVSNYSGKHWTTPAEAEGRRRVSPPSLVCWTLLSDSRAFSVSIESKRGSRSLI